MCGRYYVDGDMTRELRRVLGDDGAVLKFSDNGVFPEFGENGSVSEFGDNEAFPAPGVANKDRVSWNGGMDRRIQRQDVLPSQRSLVLAERCMDIRLEWMLWGFPRYNGSGLIINARSESALESVMFRDSLLRRRCVIPAGGFYEWNRSREMATFTRSGAPILYMAGFYNIFGSDYRYVILTTAANASVSPVHSRMPLILEEDEIRDWIFDDGFMKRTLTKIPAPLVRKQDYEQQTLRFL